MPPLQQQIISTDSYNYLLFLPHVLQNGDRNEIQQPLLPAILFLHGAGERGSYLNHLKKKGVAKVVEQQPDFPNRVYLTGLSMGGYGTWHLAAAQPERFAAIAPICGGGNPAQANKLKNLPVWAFHGTKDHVVPLSESEIMVFALKAHNGNIKFTVYPEVEHDSWTQTYNNPELYEWFLQHWRQQAAG
jgi:predicted peptidase